MKKIGLLAAGFCLLAGQMCWGQANIARNKKYTYSTPPNYPLCTDDGDATDLTDGKLAQPKPGSAIWGMKECVGWNHIHDPISITVDLGRMEPIGGVALRSAANASGSSFPFSVLIQVSEDGQNFFTIDDLMRLAEGAPPPLYGMYAEHLFKTTALRTRGRYVRFTAIPSAIFFFVDEIQIFRGEPAWLTQPIGGHPATEEEKTDPLRLTQMGVHRRLTSDLYAVRRIIERQTSGKVREDLLNQADDLAKRISSETWPQSFPRFRAVLPIGDLHRDILSLYGQALSAGGAAPLSLWHSAPYQLLGIFEKPGKELTELSVRMMMGERRAEVFNLTNASAKEQRVRFSIEGIPADMMKVYQVEMVDTREGRPVASALVELQTADKGYQTVVAGGMTRQIWLSFRPRPAQSGKFAGKISIRSEGFAREVALKVSVADIQMPEHLDLSMGMFDYIYDKAYGIIETNQQAAAEDMRAHRVNSPWCTPGSVPVPRSNEVDSEGNLTGAIDYTKWDAFVRFWPGADHYFGFSNLTTTFAGLQQGTPAFNRAIAQWAADWAKHNAEVLKLKPGQVFVAFMDEPGSEENFQVTYNFARPFREGTREIGIFVDPVGLNVQDVPHAREALELADVISPTQGHYAAGSQEMRQMYQELRASGRQLWFYMCSGPTRQFDPSYYRLQPWYCMDAGATGSQFWSYGDNGYADNWNEYAAVGRTSYTAAYLGPMNVTTSKHWEAALEGLQDYQYLAMLRQRAQSMTGPESTKTSALVESVTKETLSEAQRLEKSSQSSWPDGSSAAEMGRLRILDALEHR